MPGVQVEMGPGTEREGAALKLRGTHILAGRSERCSIRLDSELASREHAAIDYANGVWTIQDLDSHNGTYVNGKPVRTAALEPGDRIDFGQEGPWIRIRGLAPPSRRDDDCTRALRAGGEVLGADVPVLAPVGTAAPGPGPASGPAAFRLPTFRRTTLPGLLSLLGVAAILAVTGLAGRSGVVDLWPEARPATPEELFEVVTRAVRERHLEQLWDVLGPRARRLPEDALRHPALRDGLSEVGVRTLEDLARIGPRVAFHRAGRSSHGEVLAGRAWVELVRFDLDLDGAAGTLVVRNGEGATEERRVLLRDGVWRLER